MKEMVTALISALISCAVFLLLFLAAGWNLAAAALLCILLYFGLGLILKPRKKIGGIDVEKIQGGEELQKLLEEARKDLKQISRAAREITNIKAKEDAEALEAGYTQLQEIGLRTPEVTEALRKTAGTFPVLNEVFEKQFTRLMEGELMDVEAEISLLENTLKMEGGQ